ncbi:MAG: CBS domain-containing protein [Clostridiales bacterium]|nr:CBS domain-containing protein [Clostridiales bacterium]NLX69512.1 CBS domain-containing protein [Clostridiales bacterium]
MENNRTNFSEFITIYNEIDEYMRRELNQDKWISHSELIRRMARTNKVFKAYMDDLLSYARLRNAIVHNPEKRNAHPIADPHDYVIEKYKKIRDSVLSPAIALDTIAVRSENIYTASLDDKVLDVMLTMNKYAYTYVPIIEDERLIGVFSENTVFSYIVNTGNVLLDKDAKIKEFSKFIPIDKHESESFAFVSRGTPVIDIEDMFAKELRQGKRLAVVFITDTGDPDEKLLGLITAWDIAGYREE